MKRTKSDLLFNPRRSYKGAIFLLVPMSYALLVRGFKDYWHENDLRHLYKEILKPYYKRMDDRQCEDYRDFKHDLYTNKVDESKSIALRLRSNVEQKVKKSKLHESEDRTEH